MHFLAQSIWTRMMATCLTVILCLMMLSTVVEAQVSDPNSSNSTMSLQLNVKSAILLDASTGQVLYQSDADTPYPPASMSKMMTEYIVLDEIKNGRLRWEDQVITSEVASKTVGSKIFLAPGDSHTVQELFIAMAVGSANDATVALAEHIAGSEEAFAQKMNVMADTLGLETAHFINATGLGRADMAESNRPQSISGETIMSARDTAFLAYAILKDHPNFTEISSLPSYQFRARDDKPIINYNWMLESNQDTPSLRHLAYEGLDGMKTGYTAEAGYCFAGTAERNGTRLISVVMGTGSESERFVETRKLMDHGFNRFENTTVFQANSPLLELESIKIEKGVLKEVGVVTANDLSFLVEKGSTPKTEITQVSMDETKLVAPIPQGTVLGSAEITYRSDNGLEHTQSVNLIANEEVEEAGWFRLLMRAIGDFFVFLFDWVVGLFK